MLLSPPTRESPGRLCERARWSPTAHNFDHTLQFCNTAFVQLSTPGLRERKRRETRSRIGAAALELVLANGLDDATIDAISSAAGVSPRTFFNYFESKDDALLNMPDPYEARKAVETVTSVVDGMTLREVATRFFIEWLRPSLEPGSRRDERRELLIRYPHLFAAAFRRMTEAQDAFSAGLREIASARGALIDIDSPWADVAVSAAAGAVRAAVKEWAAQGCAKTVKHIEDRANDLLMDALETLK